MHAGALDEGRIAARRRDLVRTLRQLVQPQRLCQLNRADRMRQVLLVGEDEERLARHAFVL
eukprot:1887790-Prymnesium_polylepis.1